MRVGNFGQRSSILNNKSCTCACRLVAYVHWIEFRKTHPYSIKDPSVQRWETHRDPSVQSLSSKHFHFFAIFTDKKGRRFTGMTPCIDDMLIHNLFNGVGHIACLKLIPKAPIQRRKRLFLDDYPIHRALGAKPEQWKTFATRCYTPKHVYIIIIIAVYNHLLLQRHNRVILSTHIDCTPVKWWAPLVTHPYMTS